MSYDRFTKCLKLDIKIWRVAVITSASTFQWVILSVKVAGLFQLSLTAQFLQKFYYLDFFK